MNQEVNPKLVALAREMRDITQTELAKKIPSLTQGNLSRMEKGLLNITPNTLAEISLFLDLPIEFFYQGDIRSRISNFYYRKRVSLPKKILQVTDAKIAIISNCIDNLLNSVELDCPQPLNMMVSFPSRCPDDIARLARNYFDVPKGPVKNIADVLEKKGIIIKEFNFQTEKFDGITVITDKHQPIIFVNNQLSGDRKRFTLAHELGHLIMHIPFELELETDDKELEHQANLFAAEFLMPELEIRNDLVGLTYSRLSLLKEYWLTSKGSIAYRAHQLNCITSEKYKNLQIELSRRGERRHESIDVMFTKPTLLNNIISFFKQELNYTTEELCNYLYISKSDYKEFFYQTNELKLRIA